MPKKLSLYHMSKTRSKGDGRGFLRSQCEAPGKAMLRSNREEASSPPQASREKIEDEFEFDYDLKSHPNKDALLTMRANCPRLPRLRRGKAGRFAYLWTAGRERLCYPLCKTPICNATFPWPAW